MVSISNASWIKDNDPRRANDPPYKVESIVESIVWRPEDGANVVTYAVFQGKKRRQSVRLDRIFDDGKPRSNGYNVVPAPYGVALP
jgi:hypothetical protein